MLSLCNSLLVVGVDNVSTSALLCVLATLSDVSLSQILIIFGWDLSDEELITRAGVESVDALLG